jgi:hypothetical protein
MRSGRLAVFVMAHRPAAHDSVQAAECRQGRQTRPGLPGGVFTFYDLAQARSSGRFHRFPVAHPSRRERRSRCAMLPAARRVSRDKRQCALLQPIDVEPALRKQPRAVHLHERVEIAERDEHQASLSTVDSDVMRQAVSFPGASVAR